MGINLVTGGGGFIGSRLAEFLLGKGEKVRILDNFSTSSIEQIDHLQDKMEIMEGDASDAKTVGKALQGVGQVYHMAALPSVSLSTEKPCFNQTNGEVAGLTVFEECRLAGVRRIVFASSASVYGKTCSMPLDENREMLPISNYGVSKAALEMYGRVLAANDKHPDVVALRFFNVYGKPGCKKQFHADVVSSFVKAIHENCAPTFYGDGSQTRDYIDVQDVVRACYLAMTCPGRMRGEAYNIATGQAVSLKELWEMMAGIRTSELNPNYGPARPDEILHSRAGVQKAALVLGFMAEISLKTGIERLLGA